MIIVIGDHVVAGKVDPEITTEASTQRSTIDAESQTLASLPRAKAPPYS